MTGPFNQTRKPTRNALCAVGQLQMLIALCWGVAASSSVTRVRRVEARAR